MKKRIPTWYEYHWHQHPPPDDERHEAKGRLVDVLFGNGKILQLIGRWDECQDVRNETLRLSEELADKNRIAFANQELGVHCWNTGDYDQAMVHLETSIKLSPELDDKQLISGTVNLMGLVYYD